MNDSRLHKVLQDIETKANSDFALLEECGAEYFSTNDLLEMRGQLKEQKRLYFQFHKINSIIGLSAPIWGVLGIGLGLAGWDFLAIMTSMLFPITLLVFGGFYFFIKKQFNDHSYLEYIGRMIERELSIRRSDVESKL